MLAAALIFFVTVLAQSTELGTSTSSPWWTYVFSSSVIAAIVAATLGTYMTGLNSRNLESFKQQYTQANQESQKAIAEELATFQLNLQHEFAQLRAVAENEARYTMLRRSVLDAAQALLPRIREVIWEKRDFGPQIPWAPESMKPESPEANKRDTTLFRLFRFFGAYRRYRRITDWEHPIPDDPVIYFVEEKVEPVFASAGYTRATGEGPVMWRESITQIGLLMMDSSLDKSRPDLLDWLSFCQVLQESGLRGAFLRAQCLRVSQFLALPYQRPSHPAVRLAIVGVHLYDLCIDCDPARRDRLDRQQYREHFLAHILKHMDADSDLFLYRPPKNGKPSDLQELCEEYAKSGRGALSTDNAARSKYFKPRPMQRSKDKQTDVP